MKKDVPYSTTNVKTMVEDTAKKKSAIETWKLGQKYGANAVKDLPV